MSTQPVVTTEGTASTGVNRINFVEPAKSKHAPPNRVSLMVDFEIDKDFGGLGSNRDGGCLVVRPVDALGELLLRQFGHGEIRPEWRYVGEVLQALALRHIPKPMLSSGEPYFTGITLSAEEQAWLRKQLDANRKKRQRLLFGPTRKKKRKAP